MGANGLNGAYLRRKRKTPRVSNERPWVRARFEAVEMPLKRMKKSRNALQRLPIFWAAIASTSVEMPFVLLDSLMHQAVAEIFAML
jgi:hypothetical protein